MLDEVQTKCNLPKFRCSETTVYSDCICSNVGWLHYFSANSNWYTRCLFAMYKFSKMLSLTARGPTSSRIHVSLSLVISNVPNSVGVCLHLPEDRNISRIRNLLFSTCLDFRTMNRVHTASDTDGPNVSQWVDIECNDTFVGFESLSVVVMKVVVFWNIRSYSSNRI
jgi:hypothetical protein